MSILLGSESPSDKTPAAFPAAFNGQTEAVRQFLANGKVELDEHGNTPLHWACASGQEGVVMDLISGALKDSLLDVPNTLSGARPIHVAALQGHVGVINLLAKAGARVTDGPRTFDGYTPLHCAALGDSAPAIQALLQLGGSVNDLTALSQTPFQLSVDKHKLKSVAALTGLAMDPAKRVHWAATGGFHDVMIETLKQAPDSVEQLRMAEEADEFGVTPLFKAARNGHWFVARSLLQVGANPHRWCRDVDYKKAAGALAKPKEEEASAAGEGVIRSSLSSLPSTSAIPSVVDSHTVVTRGSAGSKTFRRLPTMQKVKKPPVSSTQNSTSAAGVEGDSLTPLLVAARYGHHLAIQELLSYGADIEVEEFASLRTPLLLAALHGHDNAVKTLLDAGANLRAIDASWMNALHLAATRGHEKVIAVLIEHGIPVDLRDAEGRTPLIAVQKQETPLPNKDAVVQSLLAAGARPEFVLHWAAENNKMAELKDQLMGTAIVNTQDLDGLTALHCAARACKSGIVEVLLAAHADPHREDNAGYTPLMHAAASGSAEIVRALLERGKTVGLFHRNNKLRTALHLASAAGHVDIVKLLLQEVSKFPDRSPAELESMASLAHQTSVTSVDTNGLPMPLPNGRPALAPQIAALMSPRGQKGGVGYTEPGPSPGEAERLYSRQQTARTGTASNVQDAGPKVRGRPLFRDSDQGSRTPTPSPPRGNVDFATRKLLMRKAKQGGKQPTPIPTEVTELEHSRLALILAKDSKGHSTLSLAAKHGHLEVCNEIIKVTGTLALMSTDHAQHTPLHRAARKGHLEVCRLLVSSGAPLNARTDTLKTPLLCAAKGFANVTPPTNHIEVLRYLAWSSADMRAKNVFGETIIHIASKAGQATIVRFLIETDKELRKGAATSPLLDAQDHEGRSPLSTAAEFDRLDVVKALLSLGANPNIPTKSGQTPLSLAISKASAAVVLTLIEHGAFVDARERAGGNTCLHLAASRSDTNEALQISETIVMRLAAPGSTKLEVTKVDSTNQLLETPLLIAARSGHVELAKLYLKKGCDANHKSVSGETPLEAAVKGNHMDTVRLLWDNVPSAVHREISSEGMRLIHHAAAHNHIDLLKFLIKEGTDKLTPTAEGRTAMHSAAAWAQTGSLRYLLAEGMDVNSVIIQPRVPRYRPLRFTPERAHTALLSIEEDGMLLRSLPEPEPEEGEGAVNPLAQLRPYRACAALPLPSDAILFYCEFEVVDVEAAKEGEGADSKSKSKKPSQVGTEPPPTSSIQKSRLDTVADICIGVGLDFGRYDILPGVGQSGTAGFLGQTGFIVSGDNVEGGRSFGSKLQKGDVVGVIVNRAHRTVSYTRNGRDLGTAFTSEDLPFDQSHKFNLLISMCEPGVTLRLIPPIPLNTDSDTAPSLPSPRPLLCSRDEIIILEQNRAALPAEPFRFVSKLLPIHLVVSAEKPSVDALRTLLNHGALPDAVSSDGWTPLHFCAFSGWVQGMEVLLGSSQVNPNARTSSGLTPLYLAVRQSNTAAVRRLLSLQRGIPLQKQVEAWALPQLLDPTKTPYLNSELQTKTPPPNPSRGSVAAVEPIPVYAHNPGDPLIPRDFADPTTQTSLLMAAAETGNLEVLSMLLDAGAPVQNKDVHGLDALQRAANEQVASALTQALNKWTPYGQYEIPRAQDPRQGSASLVIPARFAANRDPCCLKMYKDAALRDRTYLLMKRVSGPHLVPLFRNKDAETRIDDEARADKFCFGLVMEGGEQTLEHFLMTSMRNQHLSETVMRYIVFCMASALEELHATHIVQGDLQCRSFVRFADGVWRLVDLDTCCEAQRELLTSVSPLSMPPEVAVAVGTEKPIQGQTTFDVWALGTCLYRMLARKHLVASLSNGSSTAAAITALARVDQATIDALVLALRPAVTPGVVGDSLLDLVSALLHVDPARRPTIAEVKNHRYLRGMAPPAPPVKHPQTYGPAPAATETPAVRPAAHQAHAHAAPRPVPISVLPERLRDALVSTQQAVMPLRRAVLSTKTRELPSNFVIVPAAALDPAFLLTGGEEAQTMMRNWLATLGFAFSPKPTPVDELKSLLAVSSPLALCTCCDCCGRAVRSAYVPLSRLDVAISLFPLLAVSLRNQLAYWVRSTPSVTPLLFPAIASLPPDSAFVREVAKLGRDVATEILQRGMDLASFACIQPGSVEGIDIADPSRQVLSGMRTLEADVYAHAPLLPSGKPVYTSLTLVDMQDSMKSSAWVCADCLARPDAGGAAVLRMDARAASDGSGHPGVPVEHYEALQREMLKLQQRLESVEGENEVYRAVEAAGCFGKGKARRNASLKKNKVAPGGDGESPLSHSASSPVGGPGPLQKSATVAASPVDPLARPDGGEPARRTASTD